jgi:hypothetical protein
MRRLTIALLGALVLTGCSAVRPQPAFVTRPIAALVLAPIAQPPDTHMPLAISYVWRLGLDGSSMRLPIRCSSAWAPQVSPSGDQLLYVDWQPQLSRTSDVSLLRYDIVRRRSAVVTGGKLAAFGWTAEEEPVVVTADQTRASVRSEGTLRNVKVTVQTQAAWRAISVPDADTSATARIDFIAADATAVYLQVWSSTFGNSVESAVVRVDRGSGAWRKLYDITGPGLGWSIGEGLALGLPSRTLLGVGVPLERLDARGRSSGREVEEYRVVARVHVARLSDMRFTRSFATTPLPAYDEASLPAYDGGLNRYLVSTTTVRRGIRRLWEANSRTGTCTPLVTGSDGAPRPWPLGYVGDQPLYRSVESSRTLVRLYDRAAGRSRVIGDLGEYGADFPWYPDITLLGVQTETVPR